MPNLASTDWMIILLSIFCTLAIGLSMRSSIKSTSDFLEAGRDLPTWLRELSFLGASLGLDAVIAAGAAGARYGLRTGLLFSVGSAAALVFVQQFMMPIYYGSRARTVQEYLGLRFDTKTRVLSACLFVSMALLSAGISLALLARLLATLRIFEPLFFAYGWPREAIPSFCILLIAVIVLLYVLFAGLAGAMVNQALQFALLVAGFLPMVWKGLENIGGLRGLHAAVAEASAQGFLDADGARIALFALALGLLFGLVRWATDFRVIQSAPAAKSATAARRISYLGAAVWFLIPSVLVLPGAIAIGLPTPQSRTVIRNEQGAIYHEITVVPRAVAEGRGLVPARLDPVTQNPELDSSGHPLLDYAMATPSMILRGLPAGLLGLGLAALLASLMSSLAASITAVNRVFTRDIYESSVGKTIEDRHSLALARLTTIGGMLAIVGSAFAFSSLTGNRGNAQLIELLGLALMVFTLLEAPQLATCLLGVFARGAAARGAFAGLVAGFAAGLLHYGLTLPLGAQPGFYGGWLAAAYRYPDLLGQCFSTAVFATLANGLVAWMMSSRAKPSPRLTSNQ